MTRRKAPELKRTQPWNSQYTEDSGEIYYEHRKNGLTLAQAAREMRVSVATLLKWSNDDKKLDFQLWWEEGKIAYQAYLEDYIRKVLSGELKFTSVQEKLLSFTLRTHYREDWAERRETTLEITDKTKELTDGQLTAKLVDKLKRLGFDVKTPLDVIEGGKVSANGEDS